MPKLRKGVEKVVGPIPLHTNGSIRQDHLSRFREPPFRNHLRQPPLPNTKLLIKDPSHP